MKKFFSSQKFIVYIVCNFLCCFAFMSLSLSSDVALDPQKPNFENLLKQKSLKRIFENYDVITNSDWTDENDFIFTNAVLVRSSMHFTREKVLDFPLYQQMTSAIKKIQYDQKSGVLELEGEASGLKMHSWVQVDQKYWDAIHYKIIRGDMIGFEVDAYLWNHSGKTLAIAKGRWPKGKNRFSRVLAMIFKPLSEVVIGMATKNFKKHIEAEYNKMK